MDQNNYYNQTPLYEQPQAYANVNAKSEVRSCVDSAFSKTLASTILAWFPICSIIAIIMGSKGLFLARRADDLAAHYCIIAGGRNIAAKIMGKIGKIAGIVMTCIYSLYFFIIVMVVILAASY